MDIPKSNGRNWTVREQLIRETAVGLVIQFEQAENGPILRISGESLPFGGLEIGFTAEGLYGYGEVGAACSPQTDWTRASR